MFWLVVVWGRCFALWEREKDSTSLLFIILRGCDSFSKVVHFEIVITISCQWNERKLRFFLFSNFFPLPFSYPFLSFATVLVLLWCRLWYNCSSNWQLSSLISLLLRIVTRNEKGGKNLWSCSRIFVATINYKYIYIFKLCEEVRNWKKSKINLSLSDPPACVCVNQNSLTHQRYFQKH